METFNSVKKSQSLFFFFASATGFFFLCAGILWFDSFYQTFDSLQDSISVDPTNGSVGIGTTSPATQLHLDVEKVFPEAVTENVNGIKAVNYIGLVGALVEGIKEQQQMIDLQKQALALQKQEYKQQIKQLVSLMQKTQEQLF